MARGKSPTVRRRRLVNELRRLRESAGLTIEEVAEKLECSASKISRIETGRVGVGPRDVRDMLALYGVDSAQVDELVQLAREARRKAWWTAYGDVVPGPYVGLEAEAESVRTYQGLLIPGLLQSEGYIRALIRQVRSDVSEEEINRRVQVRAARQALLVEDDPLTLWAVVDEAALRRLVGGRAVMREQLDRLREAVTLPNVTLQVAPFSAGGHAGMDGPFVILGFPEHRDPDVVYIESTRSGVYLEHSEDVQRYASMFEQLTASALPPDQSDALIAAIARDMS
ncbi:helix-turn-helix domain-containing protein [Gandjariella thermophila]|uniref:helix-turn-helix domain-containing protein n=1 Tax=Gandjariella thermophila TaxID=1931992 RepID=UPI0010F45081|nr:helix-turn-helix transcriptional regulator [Gandjariella thermophila]